MGHAEVSTFETDLLGIWSLNSDSERILKVHKSTAKQYELYFSLQAGTNSLYNMMKYHKRMSQKYVIIQKWTME